MKSVATYTVCGVDFFDGTLREAVAYALYLAGGRGGCVFTPNAIMLARALRSPSFWRILKGASLCLADGAGVTAVSRVSGKRLCRIPGVDFGEYLAAEAARKEKSLFLFGGSLANNRRAAKRLKERYPSLKIECLQGYEKLSEAEKRILGKQPAILYICLGSPRQERLAAAWRKKLPHTLIVCLGGSVDIYAAAKRRAPLTVQRLGMEWAWRMAAEPRRLLGLKDMLFFAWYGVSREGSRRILRKLYCKKAKKATKTKQENRKILQN